MSILYLVRKPNFRFQTPWRVQDGDTVVLIHDAVLAPPEGVTSLVCAPDAEQRNVTTDTTAVTHEEIIDLAEKHEKVVTV